MAKAPVVTTVHMTQGILCKRVATATNTGGLRAAESVLGLECAQIIRALGIKTVVYSSEDFQDCACPPINMQSDNGRQCIVTNRTSI